MLFSRPHGRAYELAAHRASHSDYSQPHGRAMVFSPFYADSAKAER